MKWVFLGEVDYISALRLQNSIRDEIIERKGEERLLILEHPSIYSVGRRGTLKDVHLKRWERIRRGIKLFWTDRGGSVTYHCKGQLIAYPIISLEKHKLSIKDFVFKFTDVVIKLLKDLNIEGYFKNDAPGVYVNNEKKISSIGIHLKNFVVTHGLSLNVNCDLSGFKWITACGREGLLMTSISEIMGKEIPVEEIIPLFISKFEECFSFKMEK